MAEMTMIEAVRTALGRALEEVLYPAMEDGALDLVIGSGPRAARSALQLAHSAAQVYLVAEQGEFSESDRVLHAAAGLTALEEINLEATGITNESADVIAGFSGSKGTPFLLQVMLARPSAVSAALPVRPFGRRSTSIR